MECVFSLSLKTYGSHPKPCFQASCHAQNPASNFRQNLSWLCVVSLSDQIDPSYIKAPRTLLGTVAWGHIKGGLSPLLGSLPKQAVPENSSRLHVIILVTGRKAWSTCQVGREAEERWRTWLQFRVQFTSLNLAGSSPSRAEEERRKWLVSLFFSLFLFLIIRKDRQNIFISKTSLKSNVITIDAPYF